MIDRSEHLNELATALAKAQAIIATARKDSQNPFFRSTYADLASVWEACREPLTANGLSIAQFPGLIAGNPPIATVTTVLLHTSGQWMAETAGAPLPDQKRKDGSEEKANAQGVGSAITYLRRYALAAVASVSPADDDGNAASGKAKEGGRTSTATKGEPQRSAARATSASAAPIPPFAPIEKQNPTATELSSPPLALTTPEPDALSPGETIYRGKKLRELTSPQLLEIRKKGERSANPEWTHMIDQIDTVLAGREGL